MPNPVPEYTCIDNLLYRDFLLIRPQRWTAKQRRVEWSLAAWPVSFSSVQSDTRKEMPVKPARTSNPKHYGWLAFASLAAPCLLASWRLMDDWSFHSKHFISIGRLPFDSVWGNRCEGVLTMYEGVPSWNWFGRVFFAVILFQTWVNGVQVSSWRCSGSLSREATKLDKPNWHHSVSITVKCLNRDALHACNPQRRSTFTVISICASLI